MNKPNKVEIFLIIKSHCFLGPMDYVQRQDLEMEDKGNPRPVPLVSRGHTGGGGT